MNQPSDAVLEFAAILGEAIARVHLAGKQAETRNANAPVDSRGVPEFNKGEFSNHDTLHHDTGPPQAAKS